MSRQILPSSLVQRTRGRSPGPSVRTPPLQQMAGLVWDATCTERDRQLVWCLVCRECRVSVSLELDSILSPHARSLSLSLLAPCQTVAGSWMRGGEALNLVQPPSPPTKPKPKPKPSSALGTRWQDWEKALGQSRDQCCQSRIYMISLGRWVRDPTRVVGAC